MYPALALLALWPSHAVASPRSLAGADGGGDPCEGGRISNIFIDNHSIFDTSDPDLDPRFGLAYRAANALHFRTRQDVIRRELLFETGDCYDRYLAEESERLLRRMNFLSSVDIFPVEQEDGSVHVVVDTQDEWSTRVDLRARLRDGRLALDGIGVEESNLAGTGQSLGFHYRQDDYTREFGVRFMTPQLAASRWHLTTEVGRSRAGTTVVQSVAYPFVGEVGRWGAEQRLHSVDRHFGLVVDDTTRLLLPVRDQGVEVAVLRRLGHRGNLTLFGMALRYRSVTFPGAANSVLMTGRGSGSDGPTSDPELVDPLAGQLNEVENLRLSFLIGQRIIRWTRRRGLDSMRGLQDVRLGAEVELALGRSLPAFARDDDLSVTATLYTGIPADRLLLITRARVDARRNFDTTVDSDEWEDVLVEGEILGYYRSTATARHTLVARASGVGGWQTRTPFQLTLGGENALRGYPWERFPGGQRLILTLEDRIYFGWPFPDVLDLGGTLFVEAGRGWAAGVPFGVDTGWRSTIGAGLRGSFPAGGRTTYRLDLARPVGDPHDRGLQLILSVGESLGASTRFGDPQLLRSRIVGVGGQVFGFPE